MKHNNLPIALNLTEGTILPGAIDNLAKELDFLFCDVTGFGVLDWLEIREPGDGGTLHRFNGPLVITDLKGRIRSAGGMIFTEYVCTVVRHTDNGIQVLGGKLVGARAKSLELRFQPLTLLDDNGLTITSDSESNAQSAQLDTSEAKDSSTKEGANSNWKDVIKESQNIEKTGSSVTWEEDDDTSSPNRGDIVNHRQFGRCLVVKMDDDHISLKKPDGRVVNLGLSILRFSLQGVDDGTNVFDVHVKR